MVKKHYVITVGLETGVFYDNWTNIAPLVKNISGSIWQGADSEQEAEELFEQAKLKGNVRTLSKYPRSPGSRTSSMQRSLSSSSSSTSNPQHSRHTSTPRIAGSQSEGHVWNNASHYVPARSNPREVNTRYSAWSKATGGGPNDAKALSRIRSEPNQHISTSNNMRRDDSPSGSSLSGGGVEILSSVNNTGINARVESPAWLASYPDEEEEGFITPPLSPITSPVISSRLLGPSKSEPASTFSASFALAGAVTKKPASDDGSGVLGYHSPKPVKPSASSSYSPRVQESLGVRADCGSEIGDGQQKWRESPKNSYCNGTNYKQQDDVESLLDLVNTVHRLVKDLRIRVMSPATEIEDDILPDDASERSCETKHHTKSALSEERNGGTDVMSPRSSPSLQQQQRRIATPSTAGMNMLDAGASNCSVLFCHGRDPSPPSKSVYSLDPTSTCRHCNGTGYNAEVDTSILDRMGLSQPSLAPFHLHHVGQDPRSPFTGSKKLQAPVRFAPHTLGDEYDLNSICSESSSPMTFGRPSPTVQQETLSARTSPLIVSSGRQV